MEPAKPAPRRPGQAVQAQGQPKAPPLRTPAEIATGFYLGILSRYPTLQEIKVAEDYFQGAGNRRQAAVDLAWALLNSSEFLYRH